MPHLWMLTSILNAGTLQGIEDKRIVISSVYSVDGIMEPAHLPNPKRQWMEDLRRCSNLPSLGPGLRAVRPLVMLLVIVAPAVVFGQDTPDYYRANCMNCHTIGGGRLSGPDLTDVGKRKDAEWLVRFMQNPRAVIESGDAYAAKLVEATPGGVIMPTPPSMSAYRAEQILKLIEAESKLEKSQFQGVRVSSKPFTEEDRAAGREIFTGNRQLANGGAACIACHSMYDLNALGGGHLGPDLTRVYERLNGRKALSAWLTAPATETMQPIFKGHPLEAEEVHALAAYFEDSAQYSPADSAVTRISFLLSGLVLAAAIVFLFDAIWKGRFRSVRRPLVEANTRVIHQHQVNGNGNVAPALAPVPTEISDQHGSERGDQ
jgi:mono/diheme cytochrome c family protein